METQKLKRFTWKRMLVVSLLIAISIFLWWIPYAIGSFYKALDDLSGHISRSDQLQTRDGLKDLQTFYDLNKKLKVIKLDYPADKYLFHDVHLYQAAYDYLTGAFEKANNDLKNDENFWAYYIRANARWRIIRDMFRHAFEIKDQTKMKEAFGMAQDLKDDYEKAIKSDRHSILEPKWNYDLITDSAALMKALMPGQMKVKVQLGRGSGKKKGKGAGDDRGEGWKGKGPEDIDAKEGDKSKTTEPGLPRRG